MLETFEIDTDLPTNRAIIKFKNMDKRAGDRRRQSRWRRQEFRGSRWPSARRAARKDVAAWLNDLAQKFNLEG